MEKCIICNKQLKIKKTEDIQRRKYYIQENSQEKRCIGLVG